MQWFLFIFRNLWRNKIRSLLTILGIAIGIFSIVVLGALAEYLSNMVDEAKQYVGGVIHIVTKTNEKGENPGVSQETLQKICRLEEVEGVTPFLILLLDGFDLEKQPLLFFTPQFTVGGVKDLRFLQSGRQGIRLLQGRWLKPEDSFHALVNLRLLKKRKLRLGGEVVIRKKKYKIVGVVDLPNIPAAPDAFIPYRRLKEDFQRPAVEFIEKMFQKLSLRPPGGSQWVAQKIIEGLHERYYPYYVIPKKGVDPNQLAEKIRKLAPEVAVIPPKKLIQEVERGMQLFILIMMCVGLVSSVVASLLIVNTLIMAILERRQEIGIKMAIGASKRQIIFEFLGESACLGFLGGLLGIALGVVTVLFLNPWIEKAMETGQTIFLLSPRLLLGAFGLSLALSCLAGMYPAYRAANLNPVETLRNL